MQDGNCILKYADDIYLIIPSSNYFSLPSELSNIETWAKSKNLKLNKSKSQEMIFHQPRSVRINPPPPIPDLPRVKSLKILGVTISDNFSVKPHIDDLVSTSGQNLFAFRTLRNHGLGVSSISTVTSSTLFSKLSYASPAWRGFASVEDLKRLDAISSRAIRWGLYLTTAPVLCDIFDKAEKNLFFKARASDHLLHSLLPPVSNHVYNLTKGAHNFVLPVKNNFLSKNFFHRILFQDIY